MLSLDPSSGNEVPPEDTITLEVSKGPIIVPSVVGFIKQDAKDVLKAERFEVDTDEEFSDEVPLDLVIEQIPEPETEASPGDLVTIVVSLGPEQTATTPPTTEPTDTPTDDETPTDTPSTDIETEPGPDG